MDTRRGRWLACTAGTEAASTRVALQQRAREICASHAESASLAAHWEQHRARLLTGRKALMRTASGAQARHLKLHLAPAPLMLAKPILMLRRQSVGFVPVAYPDLPIAGLRGRARHLPVWRPPRVALVNTVASTVGHRSSSASLPASLVEEAASWELERLGSQGVFMFAALREAVASWRLSTEGTSGAVPLALLRQHVREESIPCPTCSSNSRLWSARDTLPLDELQYAECFGIPTEWQPAVVAASSPMSVSAVNFAAILGQATHWDSATLAARRLRGRMPSRPKTFATLGAGVSIMGATLVHEYREEATLSYSWFAESVDRVAAAHEAMWAVKGMAPTRFRRAESDEITEHADIELVSLRCAPFSSANRTAGRGRWAALRELVEVMRNLRRRRPLGVIMENTAGVWRLPGWRALVEAVIDRGSLYQWEALFTSPKLHSNAPMSRARVFYIGVLRQ
jgi:hypothetical protein